MPWPAITSGWSKGGISVAPVSLHEPRRGLLAGGEGRLAERDDAAVAFDRGLLHRRRGPRHDDVRRDAADAGRQSQRLRVVAAGMRHDAPRGLRVGELEDCVGRAAILERADLLQVLALEVDSPARRAGRTSRRSSPACGGRPLRCGPPPRESRRGRRRTSWMAWRWCKHRKLECHGNQVRRNVLAVMLARKPARQQHKPGAGGDLWAELVVRVQSVPLSGLVVRRR